MLIIAIDPGPWQSAWCLFDVESQMPRRKGICDNAAMLEMLIADEPLIGANRVVIEMIASYGMPVGAEVFETCVWIGRFIQASPRPVERITRQAIKTTLCRNSRAKDSNIRQRLIDIFGGKEKAIGTKKNPGPLYGFRADEWAALAVAVAWTEERAKNREELL